MLHQNKTPPSSARIYRLYHLTLSLIRLQDQLFTDNGTGSVHSYDDAYLLIADASFGGLNSAFPERTMPEFAYLVLSLAGFKEELTVTIYNI
jgi:hypothetical protein